MERYRTVHTLSAPTRVLYAAVSLAAVGLAAVQPLEASAAAGTPADPASPQVHRAAAVTLPFFLDPSWSAWSESASLAFELRR